MIGLLPPQPGQGKAESQQHARQPGGSGQMQDCQICDRRANHYHRDLKSGPEAKFRDENSDGAADFENAGDVAEPLPESDLCELLNHALLTDQFDPACHGEGDRENNGQNPGESFPGGAAYIDFGAYVRLWHRLISFRLDTRAAQNTEATTINTTKAIMQIVIATNPSV